MGKIRLLLFLMSQILFTTPLFAHGHHCCHHASDKEEHHEEFHWTKEKCDFAQIAIQMAGPGTIHNTIQVAGKIALHPDHIAYVNPQVIGVVGKILKNVGDTVDEGETLVWIESRQVAEAKSDYLLAQKRLSYYQSLLKKEESARGVAAYQDYLNAKWAFDEALMQLQFTTQHLYALGLDDKEIHEIAQQTPEKLRLYPIKSPIKGKIIQREITLGEMSDPERRIYTVANFDHMWVEMHVPQSDAPYVKEGLPVEIARGEKAHTVNIKYINPLINEETRTATAFALMENSSKRWSPGEFITVNIQTDSIEAPVVVPREAVQKIKGESIIFVEQEAEFMPRVVKLGKMDAQNVEIISGLSPGDFYAARNTFCMKADLQKEEAEHSHSH